MTPKVPSNVVSIRVAGQTISGWTGVRIGRYCESMPNTFELELTAKTVDRQEELAHVTDPVEVYIGDDLVITGYLDADQDDSTPESHTIRVRGRGRTQDIVDSQALTENQQILGMTLTQLINTLCAKQNITCTPYSGDGPPTQQFNISYGETIIEILARVAQYSNLLMYEDVKGNIITSSVGTITHKSGVTQGVNAERVLITRDASQLFSHYYAATLASQSLKELDGNVQTIVTSSAFPPNRFRPHAVVSAADTQAGQHVATLLAQFEKTRREGRAQAAYLTVDSWRDIDGQLWEPNCLIPLDLKRLGKVVWIISEVSYSLDRTGTHAHLVCLPPAALTVSPSTLFTISADKSAANAQANGQEPASVAAPDPK